MSSDFEKQKLTPMEEQYFKLKSDYPDSILLFRMGDFYEGFDDDAVIMSKVLNITLTSRSKGENKRPMAGVPWHALKDYLSKLVQAGYKVAIAEQLEDPSQAKTLVRRGVTKVVTPGTLDEIESLGQDRYNYILAIVISSKNNVFSFGISYADVLTGNLNVTDEIHSSVSFPAELLELIQRVNPSEVLVIGSAKDLVEKLALQIKTKFGIYTQEFILSKNEPEYLQRNLCSSLNIKTLKGFGIKDEETSTITAVSYLYKYIHDVQKTALAQINTIKREDINKRIKLDQTTIRNLEVFYRTFSNSTDYSLYSTLDTLSTSMGKRLLRERLLYPFKDRDEIQDQLSKVDFFYKEFNVVGQIVSFLKNINDLERLAGKIGNSSINPKQLVALKDSLENVFQIERVLKDNSEAVLILDHSLASQAKELVENINKSILDEPQTFINQGGIFCEEYSEKIAELRNITKNSRQILADIQKREIKRTGITTLKVKFNKVFGYYLEVSKGQINKVPDDYERKQTLVNAERFITKELKELETRILSAEDELIKIEQEEYIKFVTDAKRFIPAIQACAKYIADIDLYSGFALLARNKSYVMPKIIDENEKIEIINGRHPVVADKIGEDFIPNDYRASDSEKIMIITGPNMSGKSTYIRQVAIIQLMMQIGSFVPAEIAKLNVVDNIFTRIGANDDLSSGESTFMVEMIEAANILNRATEDSLVVLDEIGRGTSTYDGVAIAWSIIEYLHEVVNARVLFATHYHELIKMEEMYERIGNYNVAVDESGKEVVFLYKITEGGTDKSYGIHVAKMAGVPVEVVDRSEDILINLQKEGMFEVRKKVITKYKPRKKRDSKEQEKLL